MNKHPIFSGMRQVVLYLGIAVALATAGCQQVGEEPADNTDDVMYGSEYDFNFWSYIPAKSPKYFGDGGDIDSLHALVFSLYYKSTAVIDHLYESETSPFGRNCKHMHYDVQGDTNEYYERAVIAITASHKPSMHKSRLEQIGFSNIAEIEDSLNSRLNKKFQFLVDAMNCLPDTARNYDIPRLTAYFDEGFSVTADKTLFGRAPGTDLTDKFENITLVPIVEGLTNPVITGDFENGDRSLSKFVRKGAWFHTLFLKLKSKPAERYPEITFIFTIPMIKENMVNQVVADYFGREIGPKYTSVIYRNIKCTVRLIH